MVHGEEELDEPATQADVLLVVCELKVVIWQKAGSCNSINHVSNERARKVNVILCIWNVTRVKFEVLNTTVLLLG